MIGWGRKERKFFPIVCLCLLVTFGWFRWSSRSLGSSYGGKEYPYKVPLSSTQAIAQDIILQSYRETYGHLHSDCSSTMHLYPCFQTLYSSDTFDSHWWFRTLLRDSLNPRNGVFSNLHVLATPELEMCTFGKVATTQWRKVFCILDAEYNGCRIFPTYSQIHVDPPGPKELLPSTQKPRFVFVRDPLERFLSAYLDKCHRRPSEGHCEPVEVFTQDGIQQGMTEGLSRSKKELFQAYVDTMPLHWNMHFIPQALFCGGIRLDQYDFVGSAGVNLYRDIYTLGERYGTPDNQLQSVLDQVFDISNLKDQSNHQGRETKAAGQVNDYYTATTIRRVLQYSSIDYIRLNLTVPDWAIEILREQDVLR
jgi:Sulfotransferase family